LLVDSVEIPQLKCAHLGILYVFMLITSAYYLEYGHHFYT